MGGISTPANMRGDGRQLHYGQGLGGIQAWGYQNPLGPYASLVNNKPGTGAGAGSSTTGPVASGADKWLEDVLAGKNLPFSPAQQGAMLTQQSDMSAAAEAARNQSMDANAAASGASGRDPSLQGAKAANFAARQTANQRAAGDIASQANSANFGAQMNAANVLSNNQMTRESWQQQQNNANQANIQQFLPWNQPASGGSQKPQSNFVTAGFKPGGTNNYAGNKTVDPNQARYDREDAAWANRNNTGGSFASQAQNELVNGQWPAQPQKKPYTGIGPPSASGGGGSFMPQW